MCPGFIALTFSVCDRSGRLYNTGALKEETGFVLTGRCAVVVQQLQPFMEIITDL